MPLIREQPPAQDAPGPFHAPAKALWGKHQKLRYLIIGAWNTLVGYAIFAGLYLLLADRLGYLHIAVVSHLAAVTQSFLTQRWLVFRSDSHWGWEYVRFHVAHLASLGIGLAGLWLFVERFGIQPLTAQAILTVLIVIFSYFIHRHFTFRQAPDV